MSNADILSQAYALAQDISGTLPLPLNARRSIRRGVHGQRRSGSGEDFWQFRDYQQGDAPRDIDWRQTAKGERVFIRQRESEMPQTVFFWRDTAAGMNFSSSRKIPLKKDYADILWLAAASILLKGGERVAVLGAATPPQLHISGLPALYHAVNGVSNELPAENTNGLKGSHVVIISDFCRPIEKVLAFFEQLSSLSVSATILHMADPAEVDFPFKGHVAFHDDAAVADISIPKTESLHDAYQKAFQSHLSAIEKAAQYLGWDYLFVRTDKLLSGTLNDLSQKLMPGGGMDHA